MTAKRRARWPRSDDSKELGHNGGIEGSDDDEEEIRKSGEDATPAEPKEMPLKRVEERSPPSPSPEDAGAQVSGETFPARKTKTKMTGGVAMKTMTKMTTSKRVEKPPPAWQEEDEADDSGDASPARDPLPDDDADAGHNKSAATPKLGEKRSPPQQPGHERLEKRGPDGETVSASAPQRTKKSKKSAEKDRRKKKKKKQIKKALAKPMSPPKLLEFGLNDNIEDTSTSPDIAQEDEYHGREMAEQEQSYTSPPQDEHRDREEEQKKKMTEQEHAGDTSPPHDKDMHNAHGGEPQEEEAANQEHADDTSPPKDSHSADEEKRLGEGIPQQPKDTSPPQEKNTDQEDKETCAQVNGNALPGRNAPSTQRCSSETEKKPAVERSTQRCSSETEKKPAVERSWSYDDELNILNALVVHAQSHNGALPDSSHLLVNLTFDKIDANEDKLTDKIRKLRTRYHRFLLQGCPSDDHSRRLFKLSEILWGQVDEDEEVEPTSRDFSVLSKLYPHLAKEVKAYAETHSSRDLIMAMFMTIGDEKARDLDAKCKKQQIEAFKLELGQASLTNELLSALLGKTHVKF